MITTKLSGGLANQMFQYAAGKRLAIHHNTELQLDLSHYNYPINADTKWAYGLDCFVLKAQKTRQSVGITPPGSSLAKTIANRLIGGSRNQPNILSEKQYHFDPTVLAAPDNTCLSGYWQSARYFEDVGAVIRQDFGFAPKQDAVNQEASRAIAKTQAVSIHVRRGDYVSNANANEFHGTATLEYYRRAVEQIAGQVKNIHFFIFSDDPAWCKENLDIKYPTTYFDHNTGDKSFEDLRLMSQCQHHIIANSSFSWWGAWLNPSDTKIVIAPKQWFNDKSIDTSDLIPPTWVRI